ncbi:AT-rich interactive domain-containing protein 3A [Takifugu rubripes]|uniref:AT-rich interactive domain-containing protein 3A n=1 Tax=Takifugu rubripes TaxID=31033 RepID=UPI000298D3E7|nr:AT-rich interactive domain-containing protein 3A-like [Takifugu rubripes]XP_029685641.1 AT-rich interactive domain-containing protein 3A-like [Takifugu rubripes]|eukprot:XP_003974568.1 PREDICTED: AT-rich interactive domain-containing protein 3A-like [Takifugu rubripes]
MQCPQHGGAGTKLQAVMENLQRQQAARLALEEKLNLTQTEVHSFVESHINRRVRAFHRYQTAMQDVLTAEVTNSLSGVPLSGLKIRRTHENADAPSTDAGRDKEDTDETETTEQTTDNEDFELNSYLRQSSAVGLCVPPQNSPMFGMSAIPTCVSPARCAESPSAGSTQQHGWTYEEQFKQLYELDDDEKRKEFLDDLFGFMQKRGTPVNRIPIMAKQVLDLYMLYKLVVEKGGLVEVINKKIWREITRGLNLPTSITSAAFTLRTQYMKYLYPYECEKKGLSSPSELQAAIDSNRREGRRQSYGANIFNYSPVGTPSVLSPTKIQLSHLAMPTYNTAHISQVPVIKKEKPMKSSYMPNQTTQPVLSSPPSSTVIAVQATPAVQTAAQEQLQEKIISDQQEKNLMMVAGEQRIVQHALEKNMLAMTTHFPLNVKLGNRDDRQETTLNLSTNGISSINMSIEINGVVYTGVLFAQQLAIAAVTEYHGRHSNPPDRRMNSPPQFQPSCSLSSSPSSSSLQGHRKSSPGASAFHQ